MFQNKIIHHATSSVYGKITQILLVYTKDTDDPVTEADILERYGEFFKAMGGRIHFIILGQFGNENNPKTFRDFMNQALEAAHLVPQNHVLQVDENFNKNNFGHGGHKRLCPWVQDPFYPLHDEKNTPILLEPYNFGSGSHEGDRNIAEMVSDSTGYLIKSTKYKFEGGNLLVGDDYLIAGISTLQENKNWFFSEVEYNKQRENTEFISDQFKNLFGVNYVIWVGLKESLKFDTIKVIQGNYNRQPFFHIDLYITLGGKDKRGDEIVFVADISISEIERFNPVYHPDLKLLQSALIETQEFFRTYRDHNAGPTFKVVELPMGLRHEGNGTFIPLSYNNCLIESYSGVKNVYIPNFESPDDLEIEYVRQLQGKVQKVFDEQSVNVTFVSGSFIDSSRAGGALHCMTNVIQRRLI
jgi:hypothetical protein